MRGGALLPVGHAVQPRGADGALPARRGGDRRPGGAHATATRRAASAVLGSIQPQPLPNRPDGTLDLAEVEAAIKPDDPHFAITRLLALENTIGGKVLPRAYMADAHRARAAPQPRRSTSTARASSTPRCSSSMPVKELCAGFDSVSVCLSKGLGAPAGTVLVGSKDLIDRARRSAQDAGRRDAPGRASSPRRASTRWSTTSSASQRSRQRRAPRERPARARARVRAAHQHGVREHAAGESRSARRASEEHAT